MSFTAFSLLAEQETFHPHRATDGSIIKQFNLRMVFLHDIENL